MGGLETEHRELLARMCSPSLDDIANLLEQGRGPAEYDSTSGRAQWRATARDEEVFTEMVDGVGHGLWRPPSTWQLITEGNTRMDGSHERRSRLEMSTMRCERAVMSVGSLD